MKKLMWMVPLNRGRKINRFVHTQEISMMVPSYWILNQNLSNRLIGQKDTKKKKRRESLGSHLCIEN